MAQVEAVRLAAAGGLPTRYAYGELWDRRGMDLQVILHSTSPIHRPEWRPWNVTLALGIACCVSYSRQCAQLCA
jgi:hypothetical protein